MILPDAAAFVRLVRDSGALADDPFHLADVGCSGGIHPFWREFSPHLRVLAIDPQQAEIARLAREETDPNVAYRALFIRQDEEDRPGCACGRERDAMRPKGRSSAALARMLRPTAPVEDNPVGEHLTDVADTLDRLVRSEGWTSLDFVKIDTDGGDLEAARSATPLIKSHQVLGFMVEADLTGPAGMGENTFAAVDQFMRRQGFGLYQMGVIRRSRSALPAPFLRNGFGGTTFGQPMWGDFVYLRDGAGEHHDALFGGPLSAAKLLKLACLYANFKAPDCAAELIHTHRARLDPVCDTTALLDALVPQAGGQRLTWEQYVATFRRAPERFFLNNWSKGGDWLSDRDEPTSS